MTTYTLCTGPGTHERTDAAGREKALAKIVGGVKPQPEPEPVADEAPEKPKAAPKKKAKK